MTGKELCEWIAENKAEDLEVLFIGIDGQVDFVKPELYDGNVADQQIPEVDVLIPEGRKCIIV